MPTETHINQFIREIEEKYTKTLAAVGELKDSIEAYKQKVVSISPEVRAAIGMAEEVVSELEQKAKAGNKESSTGAEASDKKEATKTPA